MFHPVVVIAQNYKSVQQIKIDVHSIEKKLKAGIGNKRVVLLGEPTHGEGNVFEYKTEICKFLHDSLGFNVIAFESGIFDLYQASNEIKADSTGNVRQYLDNAIFSIWTQSKQFQPFIRWYEIQKGNTRLLGFECQFSGVYSDDLLDLVTSYIKKYNADFQIDHSLMEEAISSFAAGFAFRKRRRVTGCWRAGAIGVPVAGTVASGS